ncbi:MAG: alpha/beta hydrolase [Rhodococcus erythropolis]
MPSTEFVENMIMISEDLVLQVAEAGQGEPMVLICGTSQHYRLWEPLLPALTSKYHVIAYNHRGIGDSTRGAGVISMASLAGDLAQLLTVLDVERAHLLGWSLGSAVAQEFAIACPERVKSLVLAATWGRTDAFQKAVIAALAHPWRVGDRTEGLIALGLAFSPELLNSEIFVEMMTQIEPLFPVTSSQIETVVEQWDADLAHDALDRLSGTTVPTLVIAGEQDLLTPARLGHLVSDSIVGARYELLTGPGSSHAALLERTEEFTTLIKDFTPEPSGNRG